MRIDAPECFGATWSSFEAMSGTKTFFRALVGGLARIDAGETAVEFSLIDLSIFRVAFWWYLLPTVNLVVKRASAESGKSFACELTKRETGIFEENSFRARQRCGLISCCLFLWL